MKIGYARVSTSDQNLAAQLEALSGAGCEKVYKEKMSGKTSEREQLHEMLLFIRDGDYVVITKLDRLARSTRDLLYIAAQIEIKRANLEVLNINLDTKTPTGKLMLTMLGAVAEFERDIMLERQSEGIAIAKSEGKYKGRQPLADEKLQSVKELVDSGVSVSKAVKEIGIARRTYYKALEEGRI